MELGRLYRDQNLNANMDELGIYRISSFKNRIGPAGPTGSTGNRELVRSG